MSYTFNYTPDGDTIIDFMRSPAFVRGLQGPIGSGKSAACVAECLRLILDEHRCFDPKTVRETSFGVFEGERTGKRKFRGGVIRNTTPQLETTTMKTWLEWLPEEVFGKVRWRAPYRQDIFIPMPDGGDVEGEVWFLALDREEDVRKLLSFEFTWLWLNEARELARAIVTAAISRVRRYPRLIDGGAKRSCIIMDTNAPDEEHWWAIMSGQVEPPDWMSEDDRLTMIKPDNWQFFQQPPAVLDVLNADGTLKGYELNPNRENGRFTDKDYYMSLIHGQSREWIVNMLQNRIGRIFGGRAVYSGFNENLHIAKEAFGPEPGEAIHIGLDFGLTPAAAFGQDVRGQVRIFDELVTRDMHAKQFAKMLKEHIAQHYEGFKIVMTGDPAGDNRSGTDGQTTFQIFAGEGLDVQPCYTNEPEIRQGAVQTQMNMLVEGKPAYLLSPACTYLVNAKKGGYCFLKDREEVDKKSIYSHVSDAEQYLFLRMGYGKKMVRRPGSSGAASKQANVRQGILNRQTSVKQRRQASILSRGLRG
ncbi:hypothetical protein [Rhodobacter lacus]|uniref:Uncharacterized protein n=1 Tax=Rhodobacter lacus TaxID=1641972 RepID=A0ABW5ADF3_9RHOB